MPVFGDRPWRIVAGPEPPPANLRIEVDAAAEARFQRERQRLREHIRKLGEACLFKPDTPPVNVLGGYKFAGAPKIDLRPSAPKPPPNPAGDKSGLQILDAFFFVEPEWMTVVSPDGVVSFVTKVE
jgi:hypothetical protein